MEYPLAPYLYWAKSRQPAAIDLAGSNLLPCTLDDLPGVREAIDLSAPNDNGYAPLVESIAAHYGVAADRVVSADGCSGANFIAIAALAGPGDEVLIERPGYDPLIGACRLMRANVRRFDRRFEDGFAMDSGRLAREITPRTKLVIVTNPHNPSGTLLGAANLEGVGRVARQAGALVLVDEVYLDAAMLAAGRAPTSESAARLGAPFLVTNSLTKSYGLAGLRNGWIIAPDAAVAERMRRTRDVIDNANCAPSDRLARLAFSEMPRLAERTRALLAGNLREARRFFAVHAALELAHPPSSSVVFPRLKGHADAEPFVRQLLEKHGVAVGPGRFFDAPAHFRVSLAGRPAALAAGLTALSAALDAVQPEA
jgi:aspartate/methionine/tyrosine aminotransferase